MPIGWRSPAAHTTDGGADRRKLCAVSVDLDEIPFYHQIHGLPPPAAAGSHLVFDIALLRLEDFARSFGLPLTLFVIGRTLDRSENASKLRALALAGHELGNHTQNHRYDLTRLDGATIQAEIDAAQDGIERATGVRPVGFRAPGYTVTDELLGRVENAGFLYDSSVFPCPIYWAAKGAAMSAIRLRGRRSQSVLDTPRVLFAPARPYRIGHPYWKRGGGLFELPVQVTRVLRLPFIGTSLTMAGPRASRELTRGVIGEPLVNLELHGIDVLDTGDGLGALTKHQPDVKISHKRKLESLTTVLEALRSAGYRFVTLAGAARALF
jgi:peptidoglycan/xylan/chitin deacetylase (PgdA/CDA1 family)